MYHLEDSRSLYMVLGNFFEKLLARDIRNKSYTLPNFEPEEERRWSGKTFTADQWQLSNNLIKEMIIICSARIFFGLGIYIFIKGPVIKKLWRTNSAHKDMSGCFLQKKPFFTVLFRSRLQFRQKIGKNFIFFILPLWSD